MRLKQTVTKFATEIFTDVYDPSVTFVGKIRIFSEVTNSGPATQRRILETPFGESIPSERVVAAPNGQIFIVADPNYDFWNNEPIRVKYPVLPPDGIFSAGSIAEVLTGTEPETQLYAYPYYVRRVPDETEQSDFFGGFELYFSKTKKFSAGTIIHSDTDYFRLKVDSWIEGAGFSMAETVKLDNPVQVFDIAKNQNSYDPITDTYSPAVTSGVTCFVEPLRQDYQFSTPAFEK